MPRTPAPMDASAIAILTLCCAIWGGGMVVVKLANAGISPLLNAALRSVAAGLILLALARARGIPVFVRDGTLWFGGLAGVIFAIEFVGLYVGLTMTTASRATVFMHCAPFVAAAGEHWLLPGHRLTGIRLAGLLAAFAGLIVALSESLFSVGASTLNGDLLCLLGGITWGAVTVVIKTTKLARIAPERTLLYQLAVSAPILAAASALVGESGIMKVNASVAWAFAYTVLLVVVFGYSIWVWMLRTYSGASLHAFTFLTPIFGVLAGHIWLGERIGPLTFAGLILVAVGIYLVNRPPAVRSAPQTSH